MKIAVGSDLQTQVTNIVVAEVKRLGHQVQVFGALNADDAKWPQIAVEVGKRVASGEFDQGILFCWTGTGISLAANKVARIRAALCNDVETAIGARKWNDANILAMSLRIVSEQLAREILDAWFITPFSTEVEDRECVEYLKSVEDSQAPRSG